MAKRYLGVAFAGAGLMFGIPAEAAPISEEEASILREEIRSLKARLSDMERRLGSSDPVPPPAKPVMANAVTKEPAKAAPATTIGWKGSPLFASEDRSFKVKGRIQADVGYVAVPKGSGDRGFGFSNEFRRIRLGGEGKIGKGFGYKLELELSDNAVDLVDTFVTYETKSWLITVGNQNQFQSLDEMTGDTSGSLMERAAYTDAFNFERRMGASAQYRYKNWLLQTGIFTDDITALSNASDGPAGGDENNSFSVDGRIVYAPKIDRTQIHLGASGHWRTLNRTEDNGVRYRQRPYLHASNSRILATPSLTVDKELNYGVEAAAIRGPWHVVAEAHWLKAIRPGLSSVNLFGGYAEVGYFLTEGDSRAYKNGIFGATTPHRPFKAGGIGSVQINLRYDYLDMDDGAIRGGKQNAWLAGVIWAPIDNLRFNLNYGYLSYDGAAIKVNGRADYGAHVGGARFELDF